MTLCRHATLELLPVKKGKIRCLHCHLTIAADELGDGYCPECFEVHGRKRYEFEPMKDPVPEVARYRCVDCGIIVSTE
jgi:hypothetical protein